jgi:hypothetical protein
MSSAYKNGKRFERRLTRMLRKLGIPADNTE